MTCSCSCCPKWLCGCVLVALLGLTVASLGWAPNSGPDDKKPEAPKEKAPTDVKGDPYTLDHCVVCGDKLGVKGDFVSYDYEGRDMRFCCNECLEKFKAAPADLIAKADEEMIKQQMPFYPLTTCIVQPNHTLDSKDKSEPHHNGAAKHDDDDDEDEAPVNMIYKNRLVRFCCDDCPKEFKKNPAEYLKKLDEAVIARQTAAYPLTTCPVSGEKLGGMGEPVTRVIGNRMVMLCCKGCIKELRRDPVAAFAKLDAAEKDKK